MTLSEVLYCGGPGPFGPKGDFAGRTNGQTDERTDNGFKGVRYVKLSPKNWSINVSSTASVECTRSQSVPSPLQCSARRPAAPTPDLSPVPGAQGRPSSTATHSCPSFLLVVRWPALLRAPTLPTRPHGGSKQCLLRWLVLLFTPMRQHLLRQYVLHQVYNAGWSYYLLLSTLYVLH